MTELVQDLAWQADALRLRATTEMGTSEIGEAVGKHPATIRKLFARNAEEVERVGALNGHGDRVLSTKEASEAFSEPQTTVYDHLPSEEPPPEDDPEFEPELAVIDSDVTPLTTFRYEAGEPVGPMQARPGEEPPTQREMDGGEEVVSAPQIKGTAQLALDFGPDAAMVTSATVVFKSEKLTSGYFEMGDVIHGTFTARITAITGAEKLDKDLDVFVAKPQAQVATITEITVF